MKQPPNGDRRPGAPRVPGFIDLLPGQARRRRRLEQTMLDAFDSWGYELVGTPSVELLETVELGVQAEQSERLFKFMDGDGRVLALVGERTVSVARVVAGQLQQAALPLRLCYLGPTFSALPPAGGRREAHQAGAELVGAHSPAADAEVVAMAIGALEAAGLAEFQVEVGHVGFFGGLMERLSEAHRAGVRDALAGRDLVELEQVLAQTPLRAAEQELLLRFPALRGGPELLDAAGRLVDNPTSALALGELAEVHRLLRAQGVAERVNLDLGAVRDFDYYTGVIFEVFAPGLGTPLAAGGRYDGLLQRFGSDLPATGLVVFVDRLEEVMGSATGAPAGRVLVGHEIDAAPAQALASRLRRGGRSVLSEVEPGSEERLRARAAAVDATEVILCAGDGQAWVLDQSGRRPLEGDI